MTGDVLTIGASDVPQTGRLGLSIRIIGLPASVEEVRVEARGTYAVDWVCGSMTPPCGPLGCPPAVRRSVTGIATATSLAPLRGDGSAVDTLELVALLPSASCPANPAEAWRAWSVDWENVSLAVPALGMRLTPGPIVWGETM